MAQKTKQNIDKDFYVACSNGDLQAVKYLLTSLELEERVDVHSGDDYGFRRACGSGRLEIVKYLLTSKDLKEHADIHAEDDYGLRWACYYGHLEVVKYLLTSKDIKKHADIHALDDFSLRVACENGHIEIARYLINTFDIYGSNNIKNIKIPPYAKITKAEVREIIRVRDLKNQLSNEMQVKSISMAKNRSRI